MAGRESKVVACSAGSFGGGSAFSGFGGGAQHRQQQRRPRNPAAANMADATSDHLRTSGAVKLIHFFQRNQDASDIVDAMTEVAASMEKSKLFRVAKFDCSRQAAECARVGAQEHPLQVCAAS
jgi:hypothetical protein